MIIRKISIGPDYKSGAMHYVVGQPVINGHYKIHLIQYDDSKESIMIWIKEPNGDVLLWKEFTSTMPISVEYNIDFE